LNLKIPKILITGYGGLLAPYLVDVASNIGNVITTGRKSGQVLCDLSNSKEVKLMLEDIRPNLVIHAAGMTNVDECENNFIKADISNHIIADNIAKYLPKTEKLAFISTDQVYPNKEGPHKENEIGPINVYGQTKYQGELAILKHPQSVVIRTNLFGHSQTCGRISIDDFVINNLRSKNKITLFTDIFFSPLHMKTLSSMIFKILNSKYIGVINLGSREGMTKAEFGIEVAKHKGISTESVSFGKSNIMPGRAPRIHDLRLDVTLAESILNCSMPTLQQEIFKL
jgi:dTDP-4-dehydrorhamnose reductase